jgi:hypothetical protein
MVKKQLADVTLTKQREPVKMGHTATQAVGSEVGIDWMVQHRPAPM